jgi:phosphate-selective porin OprO and OprP
MIKIFTVIAILLLSNSLLFEQAFSQVATTAGISSASDPTPAPVVQAPPSQTKTNPPVAATSQGLIFSTPDGDTNLTVHGYIQAQNRMFDSNANGENLDAFLFRKIRPLFEGTLFNQVDFRFMPDFGQNQPQIQEAYLELKTASSSGLHRSS